FGGLALLSPAGTDFSWVAPGRTLPRLLDLFSPTSRVPVANLPVDQPFSDDEFRAFWGPRAFTGKFVENAVWVFDQMINPVLTNPSPGSPFFFAPPVMIGDVVQPPWFNFYAESLVANIAEDAPALARTPIFFGRG